jgi:hypothetical protein
MVATKAVVHVADAAAEPSYLEQHDPAAVAAVELGGQRTALYVTMLKESELIGWKPRIDIQLVMRCVGHENPT